MRAEPNTVTARGSSASMPKPSTNSAWIRSTRHGSVCTQSLGPRESSSRWSVVVGSMRVLAAQHHRAPLLLLDGRSSGRPSVLVLMTARVVSADVRPRNRRRTSIGFGDLAGCRRARRGCARGSGRRGRSSAPGCRARRSARRRSSRTWPPAGAPAAARNSRAAGAPSPGSAPAARSVTATSKPSNTSRTCRSAAAASRSGANRKLTVTTHSSGTTLPATPPAIRTACRPSRYRQPSISTSPGAVGRRAGRSTGAGARARRCRPARTAPSAPAGRGVVISARSVPWQPASTAPLVGSPRIARSAAQPVARARARCGRARCASASTSSQS